MMNKYSVQNLSKDIESINAWKDISAEVIVRNNTSLFNDIACVEVFQKGTQGDEVLDEMVIHNYNLLVSQIINIQDNNAFLFYSDFKLKPPTKLRSYKGILPKDIDSIFFNQQEVHFGKNSIIASLIELNSMAYDKAFGFFYDSNRSFIISPFSTNDSFDSNIIDVIVNKYMIHTNTSSIDFYQLLLYFLNYGFIYRMGGDGGDRYLSLQIFCFNKDVAFFIDKLDKLNIIRDDKCSY